MRETPIAAQEGGTASTVRACRVCGRPARESFGPVPCEYCSETCRDIKKFLGALQSRLVELDWPPDAAERDQVALLRGDLQRLVNAVPNRWHQVRGAGGRFARPAGPAEGEGEANR